jgi:predicted phage terminase large subunit-like protein
VTIAYVNGEWLGYEKRAEYLRELREERDLLIALMQRGEDGPGAVATDADLVRLEDVLDEIEKVERIHRGEYDVLYFGMTHFSEDGNPGNQDNLIPAGVNVLNAAPFHQELCGMLNDVTKGLVTRNIAWACPRRHAKTAWLSNIYLTHQIVYRKRKYIVLFSETTDVAGDFITWGKYQLKLNEKLREDYGELLHVKPSMNELDNKYEFITTSNTKVEAKGLGTQTRGLRHGSSRPDMFILDDLESESSTNTPELIEKSKSWFREEMLQAMSKEGICIYLGTILCFGSLLHYVLEERRDFESRKFSAINEYARNEALWKQWRDVYRQDSKDAADLADEFYAQNEEALLEGTNILWPGYWTYYELLKIRENEGAKAFNQEYQNNPTDEERQIFKPEHFMTFVPEDLAEANLRFYAGIDIAMGKETGDFSVIATIAKNLDTGTCYVWDIYMERVHPDILIKKAIEYTLRYQYEGIGIEAQFAQEFVADKLAEGLQRHGYPSHTRIKQIKQRTRKALRIESMVPDVQSGKLRFNRNIDPRVLEQFEMYPMHKHDDAPDGIHMGYSTAQSSTAVVKMSRKRMR